MDIYTVPTTREYLAERLNIAHSFVVAAALSDKAIDKYLNRVVRSEAINRRIVIPAGNVTLLSMAGALVAAAAAFYYGISIPQGGLKAAFCIAGTGFGSSVAVGATASAFDERGKLAKRILWQANKNLVIPPASGVPQLGSHRGELSHGL